MSIALSVSRRDKTLHFSWDRADFDGAKTVLALTLHVSDETVAPADSDSHLKRFEVDADASEYTIPVGDLVLGRSYYGSLFIEYTDDSHDNSDIAGLETVTDLEAPTVSTIHGDSQIQVTVGNLLSDAMGGVSGDIDPENAAVHIAWSNGVSLVDKAVLKGDDLTIDGNGDAVYTITGLENLKRYEILVYYVNSLGKSPVAHTHETTTEIPPAVEGLAASPGISARTIKVTWTARTLLAGSVYQYWIYRSTENDDNYSKIAEVDSNTLEYVDGENPEDTLEVGTRYVYKVKAVRQRRTDIDEDDTGLVNPNDTDGTDNIIEGALSSPAAATAVATDSAAPTVVLSAVKDSTVLSVTVTNPTENEFANVNGDPSFSGRWDVVFQVGGTSISKVIAFTGDEVTQNYDITTDLVDDDDNTKNVNTTYGAAIAVKAKFAFSTGDTSSDGIFSDNQSITLFTTPAAATNVEVTSLLNANNTLSEVGNGKLEVRWTHAAYDQVGGVDGTFTNDIRYKIIDTADGDAVLADDITPVVGANDYTLTSLTFGTAYNGIKVQAYFDNTNTDNKTVSDAGGSLLVEGVLSAAAAGAGNIPFLVPSAADLNLSLDASAGEIAAAWEQADQADMNGSLAYFAKYILRYYANADTTTLLASREEVDVTTVAYTQAGLTNGLKYQVRLFVAISFVDEVYGAVSFESADFSSATRTPFSVPVTPSVAVSPYNPDDKQEVSVVGNGKLWVRFTTIEHDYVSGAPGEFSNAVRYKIYNDGAHVVTLDPADLVAGASANGDVITYIVSSLSLGQLYNIELEALFNNSESGADIVDASRESDARDDAYKTPFAKPDAPVIALTANDGSITADWNAVSGNGLTVDGYELQRDLNQDGTANNAGFVDIGNVITSSQNMNNGIELTITVKARTVFLAGDADEETYYSATDSASEIAYGKPILVSDNLAGTTLTLTFQNNGRKIREVLLVKVPQDNDIEGLIDVDQLGAVAESFDNATWDTNNNNDNQQRVVTVTLSKSYKTVLYALENIRGSAVGTTGTALDG